MIIIVPKIPSHCIGSSRGIAGTWEIPNATAAVFRHRFLITCGALDRAGIEQEWELFATA